MLVIGERVAATGDAEHSWHGQTPRPGGVDCGLGREIEQRSAIEIRGEHLVDATDRL